MATSFANNIVKQVLDLFEVSREVAFHISTTKPNEFEAIVSSIKINGGMLGDLKQKLEEYKQTGFYQPLVKWMKEMQMHVNALKIQLLPLLPVSIPKEGATPKIIDEHILEQRVSEVINALAYMAQYLKFNRENNMHPHLSADQPIIRTSFASTIKENPPPPTKQAPKQFPSVNTKTKVQNQPPTSNEKSQSQPPKPEKQESKNNVLMETGFTQMPSSKPPDYEEGEPINVYDMHKKNMMEGYNAKRGTDLGEMEAILDELFGPQNQNKKPPPGSPPPLRGSDDKDTYLGFLLDQIDKMESRENSGEKKIFGFYHR